MTILLNGHESRLKEPVILAMEQEENIMNHQAAAVTINTATKIVNDWSFYSAVC